MKKIMSLRMAGIVACLFVIVAPSLAQKTKKQTASSSDLMVPMVAERWEGTSAGVEFVQYKNVPAMKIIGKERIMLKDYTFSDGTIEYDVEPLSEGFAGIYFHMADNNETEYLYLRTARAGSPVAMDAIQYAPYNKGVLLWDMYYWFQGPAKINKSDWNHVKLIVSGAQMVVYVNDINTTTLEIPQLEGNQQNGRIAFDGKCIVANVVIKPGKTEGLSARAGFDPTHHDPRYIRTWQVSKPNELPRGKELIESDYPNNTTEWLTFNAERRGMINLTREYGASNNRRYAWLRTKIHAPTAKKVTMSLGFSDDVWVYINKSPVFVDRNDYRSAAMRKKPDGRISIENSRFEIPLKEGDNELLIGLANDFYGWGIIALLEDMEGLTISTDFPKPPDPPKDLTKYTGTYKSAEFPDIVFTAENNTLMGKNPGQPSIALEYFDTDKFRYTPGDIVVEFHLDERKFVLRQGGRESTFVKQ
ncbi:hypothetical protein WBG78_16105 [Chryseolinea sp. T2]|uniref:hypothetical protein n=1 Tax=Chryseolinea sp. T2 TaxID=3129255 RepID=UPI003076DC9C